MDADRLDHFRQLLLAQLRQHARQVSSGQAEAANGPDDGAMESSDLASRDINSEMTLKLGEQESRTVADIDQALLRIKEGSYGECVRCGKPIDERRLEVVPAAR